MDPTREAFSKFVVDEGIIRFGEFILKSKRVSPYFFNFGSFDDSRKLTALGSFYASTIVREQIEYDVIFGPAYKGIPISLTTALALFNGYGINANFAFNRKEAKAYGEGGNIIGSGIAGKNVLAVDDVLTSGRTIKDTKELIEREGGRLAAFLVALDREEKGQEGRLSALEEAALTYDVNIYSVASIRDIVAYMRTEGSREDLLDRIGTYLQLHGTG
ncbi:MULTISPECIES: orotate phosphoribosyltransferase [Paenibacillus]|uniref:orotate phosphoribosyltransferase n=1 Tax=Paenibacillus TaxID=44249 RepID=UPI00020D7F18|nr:MULTISPECIES: orotate phosphoribosyltransferase [Paenibacillus]EGL17722.1 orotate phosphoribosyltransferase [Paenibacillus sp. HGF7]EPD81505.1 orotate phosphoribosyltransferase [Paenibacillus sp. HGH0039]MBV6715276.1 orotate phosphoribosyltransferase [Paenibacillus chitinolyticus]